MQLPNAILLDPTAPDWAAAVDTLWAVLGYPHNPQLFPPHFVKTTFPRIGGRLLQFGPAAAALLFPRGRCGDRLEFTLRLHAPALDLVDARATVAAFVGSADVFAYRPSDARTYGGPATAYGEYSIGPPSIAELPAINRLHQEVWAAAPGDQYPLDIHSAEFGPGTSLVARRSGQLVGFLFGFVRFAPDGAPAIESQLLAVAPDQRRGGLALILKRAQAAAALQRGMPTITWTADPLQWPNAVLNFARLRAVADTFYPNYYPFQNALNRVPASRLGLTWRLDTPHGAAGRAGLPAPSRDLARFPGVVILNTGLQRRSVPAAAPAVAVEIPADWTGLQRSDPLSAQHWRAVTDELFAEYVGSRAEQYTLTDIAVTDDRRYLVAIQNSEFRIQNS